MTTIVIADIHNRVKWIEPALEKLKEKFHYDEVVFLGDYFDQFHDSAFDAQGTALWLKQSLSHPDRIHLVGNHDMPYMVPTNDSQWCPGFTPMKCKVIRENLKPEDFAKLKPCYYTQGWLLSHAGFCTNLFGGTPMPEELVAEAEKAFERVKMGFADPVFLSGSRMGGSNTGGITWCDWDDEFAAIPNVNQIVGHTPAQKVRKQTFDDSTNYCIDTNNQHIIVITDGVVTVHLRSQLLGF